MNAESKELRLVLLWATLVVVVASLPYVYGLWLTPEGLHFAGFTQNIDDAAVYLSWTRQATDGSIFIKNNFTSDPQLGRQVNLLFLAMGSVARVTGFSGAVVYHLFRVAFGVILLVAVWRFAGLFLKDRLARIALIPTVGLSSGIGWLIPDVQSPTGSVDVWQPEAITFLSIYLNPLFLAGLLLMLGGLYYLVLMERTGKVRYAVLAGLHVLLLANVHTYDVLTVAVVWLVYLAAGSIVSRRLSARTWVLSLVAATVSLPAVAYQFYNYFADPVFRNRANDVIASPPLLSFLTGYGMVLVFAVLAAVLIVRENPGARADSLRHYLLPLVWSVVGFAVPYLPIAQQRKLIMGVHIPLCILTSIVVVRIIRSVRPAWRAPALAVLLLVAFQSNLQFLKLDTALLSEGRTVTRYYAFLTDERIRAMEYIRTHAQPDQATLADPQVSLFLPGYAGRPVYYGHWSETPDYEERLNRWALFARPDVPSAVKRQLLRDFNCDYVILETGRPGQEALDVSELPMQKVAAFGAVEVYEVQE